MLKLFGKMRISSLYKNRFTSIEPYNSYPSTSGSTDIASPETSSSPNDRCYVDRQTLKNLLEKIRLCKLPESTIDEEMQINRGFAELENFLGYLAAQEKSVWRYNSRENKLIKAMYGIHAGQDITPDQRFWLFDAAIELYQGEKPPIIKRAHFLLNNYSAEESENSIL